jgi:KUP system potassium uptake protein
VGVVLYFQSSARMESAYGLAITVTMLMTTILLTLYLSRVRKATIAAIPFALFFGAIESFFFFSSLTKFTHGGYVTVLLALAIFLVMLIWHRGTRVEMSQRVNLPVRDYIGQLRELSHSEDIPYMADNLVFLTNDQDPEMLDRDILYSILDKRPKRAKAYWFLNVAVTDEPYTHEFWVNDYGTDFLFKVQLRLGFQVNQRVNEYLYQVVGAMVEQGRLPAQDHRFSIYERTGHVGDFRFCLVRKVASASTDLTNTELGILQAKYFIRGVCGSPDHWYGLQNSDVIFEYVPLFVGTKRQHKLTYVEKPEE